MKALIVYESEFGATRLLADAVARGLAGQFTAAVVDVRVITPGHVSGVDLLVLGSPTHALGMPNPNSRKAALDWPARPGSTLRLEPFAGDDGMREWLAKTDLSDIHVAAFATRMNMNRILSGSAAPALRRLAVKAGGQSIIAPKDFLVEKDGSVVAGELGRAEEWGRQLSTLPTGVATPAR